MIQWEFYQKTKSSQRYESSLFNLIMKKNCDRRISLITAT